MFSKLIVASAFLAFSVNVMAADKAIAKPDAASVKPAEVIDCRKVAEKKYDDITGLEFGLCGNVLSSSKFCKDVEKLSKGKANAEVAKSACKQKPLAPPAMPAAAKPEVKKAAGSNKK